MSNLKMRQLAPHVNFEVGSYWVALTEKNVEAVAREQLVLGQMSISFRAQRAFLVDGAVCYDKPEGGNLIFSGPTRPKNIPVAQNDIIILLLDWKP